MSRISILRISWEVALIVTGYFVYAIARGLIYDNQVLAAFNNAWEITRLERAVGVFAEVRLQDWFLDNGSVFVELFNWFYILGYWPIILPMAAFLYLKHPQVYKKYRTVALITFSIALIIYELYPLAPPRMLSTLGFVDTIRRFGLEEYHAASNALFYNPYAAMPSLHMALPTVVCLGFIRDGNIVRKLLAFGYLGIMFTTIVVTGNHYIVDALGAVGVVCLALIIYDLWGYIIYRFGNDTHANSRVSYTRRFVRSVNGESAGS